MERKRRYTERKEVSIMKKVKEKRGMKLERGNYEERKKK
jgi:hypothetical protein